MFSEKLLEESRQSAARAKQNLEYITDRPTGITGGGSAAGHTVTRTAMRKNVDHISKSIHIDKILAERDLHIHVPEGAVPKDGPSAGITLVTALTSLVTGKPVAPNIAMTGEISLRGNVMPIGGLPEKLMAAVRAGVKTVFIPEKNVEDLEDVAEEVKKELNIVPVKKIKDVISQVL